MDPSVPKERRLRFLALGDSHTIGEAVEHAQSWPLQLAALLRGRGVAVDDPVIVAKTGWTTAELMEGIDEAQPEGVFDLVSLLVGVNDQYRERDAEEYRKEFGTLLDRAIRLAGGEKSRVVVLSIPDWGATPYAEGKDRGKVAEEIDRFNEINRKEAGVAGVHYLDITGVSREAANDPALLAEDGLHPSGRMHARWACLAFEEMFPGIAPHPSNRDG